MVPAAAGAIFQSKNMHWILQNDIFSEAGWNVLTQTMVRFGLSHSVHKVIPFVGELVPPPAIGHKNAICIGSYSMRHVAAREGWYPGVFDLGPQDFVQQHRHWGDWMLNAGSVVSRFRDADFYKDRLFVRPVSDAKFFAVRVFGREEFNQWQKTVCRLGLDDGSSLTPETLIQLARPTEIHAEYRFWVVNVSIVTKSVYKRGDSVVYAAEVDERLDHFVEQRLAQWMPHATFVIDVCDTPDGMKIVEINTLNAAGFYAADVQRLVMALEAAYSS
jgi:hypothetical protein